MKAHSIRYYCLLMTALSLCLLLTDKVKADIHSSGKRIEIYTYGPGFIQIIDVYGRRSGRDFSTGDILEEIPRSKVVREGTRERMPGWTIHLQDSAQGLYRLKLLATGSGAFAVDIDTVDTAGALKNSHIFRRVKLGDSLEFHLTYRSDPQEKSTLKEMVVR